MRAQAGLTTTPKRMHRPDPPAVKLFAAYCGALRSAWPRFLLSWSLFYGAMMVADLGGGAPHSVGGAPFISRFCARIGMPIDVADRRHGANSHRRTISTLLCPWSVVVSRSCCRTKRHVAQWAWCIARAAEAISLHEPVIYSLQTA